MEHAIERTISRFENLSRTVSCNEIFDYISILVAGFRYSFDEIWLAACEADKRING